MGALVTSEALLIQRAARTRLVEAESTILFDQLPSTTAKRRGDPPLFLHVPPRSSVFLE